MSYDPNTVVSDTNPRPITQGSGFDPTKIISSTNPLPVTIT